MVAEPLPTPTPGHSPFHEIYDRAMVQSTPAGIGTADLHGDEVKGQHWKVKGLALLNASATARVEAVIKIGCSIA